jgi:hypothetical protein
MRERKAHWVRPNHANRYPRRIVTLDSEAHKNWDGKSEHHTFRVAVASADIIDPVTLEPSSTEWCEEWTPELLWEWIDDFTRSNGRTVLCAHNLGYDLRVTQAFECLPDLGWSLAASSLDNYRSWFRWKRGRRSLVMVDTFSYLPVSLHRIALALGRRRAALPKDNASREAWLNRCRKDVEITREAMLNVLQWLERNDCGSFRITGAAQGTAFYRHCFLPKETLLVHNHTDAIAAERRAAWTGRTEAWKWGRIPGYVFEWDYRLAYATLAARLSLPHKFVGWRDNVTRDDYVRLSKKYALLCEVRVDTKMPLVPAAYNNRILWPTGKFTTTLWDIELEQLLWAGQSISIRRAYLYRRAPILRKWARWIIDALDGDDPETNHLARIMLKGWARSTIGRFALRYPLLRPIAEAPESNVEYLTQLQADTNELGATIQVGRSVLEHEGFEEGQDAMPAVMSYIMAAARVRLWHAIEAVGAENLAYIDTDSLVVNMTGARILDQLKDTPEHAGLRFKARYRNVEILAPRMVLIDTMPRVSGLSKDAKPNGTRRYSSEVFESTRTALRRGRASEVVVSRRNYTLAPKDRRRKHLPGGATDAIRINIA